MLKVYDFECKDCGSLFEKFVKPDHVVECPACGSIKTEVRVSSSAFKVYGDGAYTNRMKVK